MANWIKRHTGILGLLVLTIVAVCLPATLGLTWVQNVGLLSADAIVFASNAPAIDRFMARSLGQVYGNRCLVCDGTDDQVQIQAAIDVLPVVAGNEGTGGTVRLSQGTFDVSEQIVYDALEGVVVRGAGQQATYIKVAGDFASGNGIFESINESQNCDFRDFTIYGSHATYSGSGAGFYGAWRWSTFENVKVAETEDDGWHLCGTSTDNCALGCVITNCYTSMVEGDGYEIGLYASDTWVTDSVANGSRGSGLKMNAGGSQINHLHSAGNNEHGIDLAPDRDINNVTIHGCYMDKNHQNGINASDHAVNGISIMNNTLWGSNAHYHGAWVTSHEYDVDDTVAQGGNYYDCVEDHTAGVFADDLAAGKWVLMTVLYSNMYIAPTSGHIFRYAVIEGNIFDAESLSLYNLNISAVVTRNTNIRIAHNVFKEAVLAQILHPTPGTNVFYESNNGWVTENWGSGSLLNGNTSVIIAHGLSVTPTSITITWRENPTNAIGDWWLSSENSTSFTLNGVDPGASNLDFYWYARV